MTTTLFRLLLTSTLLANGGALAETSRSDCKSIKNDSERLKCFDTTQTTETRDNHWQISDDRDPIDDQRRLSAILRDETGNARIELACKTFPDGKSFLLAGVTLPQFYMTGPGAHVTYRINADPPVVGQRWGKLPNTANLMWILEPLVFFKNFKDNDSLYLRVQDLAAELRSQDAKFNMANFSETWMLVQSACPEPPAVAASTAKPKTETAKKPALAPAKPPLKSN
jgi:hypothetical protein